MNTRPARILFGVQLVAALAVVAYCALGGLQQFSVRWYIALLVVTVEAATVIRPFAVIRAGSRGEFTAGGTDFVVASLLLSTRVGLIAIACGYALGHILRREATLGHLYDLTCVVISAFLGLAVAHLISPNPGLSVGSIAAAVVAAVTYELFDMLLLST